MKYAHLYGLINIQILTQVEWTFVGAQQSNFGGALSQVRLRLLLLLLLLLESRDSSCFLHEQKEEEEEREVDNNYNEQLTFIMVG